MNLSNVKRLIKFLWDNEDCRYIPPYLWGPAGVGKTQIMFQVVEELITKSGKQPECINLKLAQLEPGDLIGIPIEKDSEAVLKEAFNRFSRQKAKEGITDPKVLIDLFEKEMGRAMVWMEPEWWPEEEAIIMLDEYNRMQPITANCVLELVNERRVHTHQLPPGCIVVAAANPVCDDGNYAVNMIDDAHMGRFCHIKVVPTKEEWIEWASGTGKFDHNIMAFIGTHDDALGNLNVVYELDIKRQPRTWEMFNDVLVNNIPDDLLYEVGSGLVGKEFATAFKSFIKNDEKPLRSDQILSWNKQVKETIQRWSKKTTEGRPDLLAVSANILIGHLQQRDSLEKKESESLLKYLKAVPADSGFMVVKSLVRIKWVHDILRQDEDLYKKLEEASREARA